VVKLDWDLGIVLTSHNYQFSRYYFVELSVMYYYKSSIIMGLVKLSNVRRGSTFGWVAARRNMFCCCNFTISQLSHLISVLSVIRDEQFPMWVCSKISDNIKTVLSKK
jgi:hypothetical protein